MSADKSGSPTCGIYVRIDDFSNMLNLIGYVRQMAFAINRGSGYEKNMAVVELVHTEENAERIVDIIPVIQDQGLVAIVSGASNVAEADGILSYNLEGLKSARDTLSEDKLVGITASEDTLQDALLLNTDFIVLPADPAIIAEVSRKTDAMCVARSSDGLTNENCGFIARSGAGFVDVSAYVMGYDKGVMQATVNVIHAIDMATQAPKEIH